MRDLVILLVTASAVMFRSYNKFNFCTWLFIYLLKTHHSYVQLVVKKS